MTDSWRNVAGSPPLCEEFSASPLLGAGVSVNDDGGRDFFGNPASGAGSVGAPNIGAYQGPGIAPAALPFGSLVNQRSVANAANPRNGAVTAGRRTFSEEALAAAGFGDWEAVLCIWGLVRLASDGGGDSGYFKGSWAGSCCFGQGADFAVDGVLQGERVLGCRDRALYQRADPAGYSFSAEGVKF